MKRENPSSVRSKKMLVESLLALMHEKPYHKITIQDITKKANLARMTFYGNFDTKEDILKYHFDNLLLSFIDEVKAHDEIKIEILTLEYFKFWGNHSDLVEIIYQNDLDIMVKLFEKYFFQLNKLFQFVPDLTEDSQENIYSNAFIVGGTWNLLIKWITRGMEETPEEMTKIFMSWRNKIIQLP